MNLETFNRIESLKFLSGSLDTQNLFNLEIEDLMAAAKDSDDQDLVKTLKQIGRKQIGFLIAAHFKLQIDERRESRQAADGENI